MKFILSLYYYFAKAVIYLLYHPSILYYFLTFMVLLARFFIGLFILTSIISIYTFLMSYFGYQFIGIWENVAGGLTGIFAWTISGKIITKYITK